MNFQLFSVIFLGLVIFSSSTNYSPACPSNHIWNDGCVKLCTHPDFTRCNSIPSSKSQCCALSREGRWRTQSYSCGACRKNDVVGVKDGSCGCEIQGCPSGKDCVKGECVSIVLPPVLPPVYPPVIITCPASPCSTGFKCAYGKCIPSKGYCNSQTDCQSYEICLERKCVDRCASIRCRDGFKCIKGQCVADPKQCRYSYECPQGFKCTSQGKCVDKCFDIVCIATTTCIDGECVPICQNIKCQSGFECQNGKCLPIFGYCSSSNQCKSTQICHLNRCVNFCSLADCPSGTICKGNQCISVNTCTYDSDCPAGKRCKSRQCIDPCAVVFCGSNSKCYDGRCIPNQGYCYSDSHCPSSQQCKGGVCVTKDKCYLIDCAPGYKCTNGQCNPIGQCFYDRQCAYGKKCLNNNCVDACRNIVCPSGTICQLGKCVSYNPCAAVSCITGTKCQNGKCIAIYPTCLDDLDCKSYQFCLQNKCTDKCALMRCASNFICEQGQCVSLCSKVLCPLGSKCQNGVCVPTQGYCRDDSECSSSKFCSFGRCLDRCSVVTCPQGSYCENGDCKIELDVCPVDSTSEAFVCPKKRPTLQTCPVIYYVVAPTPNVCGIKKDGSRFDFVRTCEACLDPQIDYYFDAPCNEVPFVCAKDEKCQGYYCVSKGCRNDNECPYNWQICSNGQCVDRCSILKCRNCKCGKCAYVEPYGKCKRDDDCDDKDWSCFGWSCVDRCQKKKCKAYERCEKGECKPVHKI